MEHSGLLVQFQVQTIDNVNDVFIYAYRKYESRVIRY